MKKRYARKAAEQQRANAKKQEEQRNEERNVGLGHTFTKQTNVEVIKDGETYTGIAIGTALFFGRGEGEILTGSTRNKDLEVRILG